MRLKFRQFFAVCAFLPLIINHASGQSKPPIAMETVKPGETVSRGDKKFQLLGTPIAVGKPLPAVPLTDAMTMREVDLSRERDAVLFLSVVPSIDTAVCEEQTHYLGEEGDKLPQGVRRITISRDTPFAQKRFAQEAGLTDIQYLSDYKEGSFGLSTGLLLDGLKLLARAVILVDKPGMVRYIQVVPEITHLPDMERAFQTAIQLADEG
jgi:thiol peroxidase